ncbi:hypothetical protein MNEG_9631 [Monoraphidium neglectum]|uniref:Uncharacterized protein n=1 Tax=Monoraphidium neglectum TaxID=145388 RepID=A0A0D2KRX4_9CHLO|nr:hypothetical protein MNEG_9631 [Monoraphidium neglectum]KIY98328.1 hypothetical protein MNEG_9631 [Monoraphidium neglectum]|eukprot:XP_013897348.1 hypothetical protein MNEG_9631 [Monoraphidium neglectum]
MSINLTAQLERNMMAKNYHKVVELFEEFVWRGHHAAAAAADAAAKQAEACTPQASEAAGAQRDGAAAPAAGRAEAGADGQPPPQPQQQGSQRQRRQQQAQRQQLPRDFRPDRRAFGMYYKALKLAHFHYGQWEGLSELRVKTTLDLEMDVHGMHSTSGLEAKLIAAHLNRRPPSDVAQIFDDVRARGGAGAFPFFNLAIRSALRGRQPERAAGLLRQVLDEGVCATSVSDRARVLEPLCSQVAAEFGAKGDINAAGEWLKVGGTGRRRALAWQFWWDACPEEAVAAQPAAV